MRARLFQRRKLIYWAVWVTVFLGICWLAVRIGFASTPARWLVLAALCGGVPIWLAESVCRRLGLSLESRTKSVVFTADEPGRRPVRQDRVVLPGAGAAVGPDGILGTSVRRGRARPAFLGWHEVGACELEASSDVLGKVTTVHCLVRDRAGLAVLRVDLSAAPEDVRRRFLDMVRGEPARPELEAAEPPAGRGTELSGAAEPGMQTSASPREGQRRDRERLR